MDLLANLSQLGKPPATEEKSK